MVEECGEVSHTSTSIVSFEAALEYLDMTGAVVDSDGTPQTLSFTISISIDRYTIQNPAQLAHLNLGMGVPTYVGAQIQLESLNS
jgi:hypothetical protein